MTSKRKEREASEDAAPPAKKVHTKHKPFKAHPPKARPPVSVNELKRRIRDVKRLLNKKDLPADVRVVQERALAGYQKDLEDELARRKRSEMIKKYHFVRFLERKAATKELKRLLRKEQEISKSSSPTKEEDLKRLAPLIHTARVNLNYTIYHPLTEKYISLYPTEKKKEKKEKKQQKSSENQQNGDRSSASDAESDCGDKDRSESQQPQDALSGISDLLICEPSNEKPPMWYVVEKCMKDNTLDLLREGKLDTGLGKGGREQKGSSSGDGKDASKSQPAKDRQQSSSRDKKGKQQEKSNSKAEKKKKGSKKGKEDVEMRDADEDESDGGFFE